MVSRSGWARCGSRRLAVAHAHRILRESACGGGPAATRAVRVVDAAVARTHEEARVGQPAHRAAEVRAVDREGDELVRARRAAATPRSSR